MAFEPRFASGAVWGGNHNWAEVQQQRLKREGENPVPHYWNHVMWVFGAKDMDEFMAKAAGMTLNGMAATWEAAQRPGRGLYRRNRSASKASWRFTTEISVRAPT